MNTLECDTRNDAPRCHDRTADTIISIFLIISSVVGVLANIASCYLFYKQKSKNSNALFFRRVYIVITAVDAVICLVLFPVIEALLSGRRSELLLFRNPPFCTGWYIIWIVVQQETIFLVALLSMSRLYLLKYPLKTLHLPLARVAPLVYALIVLFALCVLPLATHFTPVNYRDELAICWLTAHQPERTLTGKVTLTPPPTTKSPPSGNFFDPPNPEDVNFLKNMLIKTVIESSFFGLPVMPILLSLFLSLYYLGQEIHHQTDNHKDRLVTAAKTVILITSVYVLFNLPALAKGIYLTYIYATSYHHLARNDTYQEFYEFSMKTYQKYGRYGWDYIWLFVYTVLPVCKSVISPALYFWRIKSFRKSMIQLTISTVQTGQGSGYRVLDIKAGRHFRRVESTRHILNNRIWKL